MHVCVCMLFDDEAKLYNQLNFSLKCCLRATFDFERNIFFLVPTIITPKTNKKMFN